VSRSGLVSRTNGHPDAAPTQVRCAIYVRKSTEVDGEQAFNSLDAQRLACEDYVRARASEKWAVLPEHYTDGGWSGATVKRPAFQRLLEAIEAREVDCVVVHRVDRLSRSLLDFARLMAFFQEHGVAFVCVTQNFSTADAVGRMTLNLLAVFSEFEREMIVARTRDKVAAARRKGRWTGGMPILGYDLDPRGGRLVVNEAEAD
jgi:site-specific DNA recombinase